MESREEGVLEGLLGAFRPPRLEDAGLEDCALPPESIMEAFTLAAGSLKPRVVFSFPGSLVGDALEGEEGGCVQNPGPTIGQIPDKLLGDSEISLPVQPLCGGAGKEVEQEDCSDDVVIFGDGDYNKGADKVFVVGIAGDEAYGSGSAFGGKRGCTSDGEFLPGEKDALGPCEDLDEDDENKAVPILIEGLI